MKSHKSIKEEARVKKYVDAWCEGKRVQYSDKGNTHWIDEDTIGGLLLSLSYRHVIKLRIGKGQRV